MREFSVLVKGREVGRVRVPDLAAFDAMSFCFKKEAQRGLLLVVDFSPGCANVWSFQSKD